MFAMFHRTPSTSADASSNLSPTSSLEPPQLPSWMAPSHEKAMASHHMVPGPSSPSGTEAAPRGGYPSSPVNSGNSQGRQGGDPGCPLLKGGACQGLRREVSCAAMRVKGNVSPHLVDVGWGGAKDGSSGGATAARRSLGMDGLGVAAGEATADEEEMYGKMISQLTDEVDRLYKSLHEARGNAVTGEAADAVEKMMLQYAAAAMRLQAQVNDMIRELDASSAEGNAATDAPQPSSLLPSLPSTPSSCSLPPTPAFSTASSALPSLPFSPSTSFSRRPLMSDEVPVSPSTSFSRRSFPALQ